MQFETARGLTCTASSSTKCAPLPSSDAQDTCSPPPSSVNTTLHTSSTRTSHTLFRLQIHSKHRPPSLPDPTSAPALLTLPTSPSPSVVAPRSSRPCPTMLRLFLHTTLPRHSPIPTFLCPDPPSSRTPSPTALRCRPHLTSSHPHHTNHAAALSSISPHPTLPQSFLATFHPTIFPLRLSSHRPTLFTKQAGQALRPFHP